MTDKARQIRQIRILILIVIIVLLLSGITVFPLEQELEWLLKHSSSFHPGIRHWIGTVHFSISQMNQSMPYLFYGYDWLAFAHIMIALAYIGPYRNPVQNRWVIDWGIICCILVLPLALIAGPIRSIPFSHQLLDCSFGIVGIIPLLVVRQKIKRLMQQA